MCHDPGYVTSYRACIQNHCPSLPEDIQRGMNIGCSKSSLFIFQFAIERIAAITDAGTFSLIAGNEIGSGSLNLGSAAVRTTSIASGVTLAVVGVAVSLF
jgi:hypothetical protein